MVGRPGPKAGKKALEAAIAAAKKNDLDTALAKSQQAIEQNPNLEMAYLLSGSICAMKGDLPCEQDAYEKGLAALPRSVELLRARALLHVQQGQYDAAIDKYKQANTLSGGKSAEVMAELAYAYVYAEQFEQALATAKASVELNKKCFECVMTLGQAYLSMSDFPAALGTFDRARQLKPKDVDAGKQYAKTLFLSGKQVEAHALFEELVSQAPDDAPLRILAARVAMAAERYAAAVTHLKVLDQTNPNQKRLLEMLALAQEKAGDKKAAAATRQRASKL